MGDFIVISIVIFISASIVRKLCKDRKNGNMCNGCRGDCSNCNK